MISIVVPAYNEEARVGSTLDAMIAWLDAQGEDYEILVADDGSKDGTVRVVEERRAKNLRVRVVPLPENRGKGAAVRTGVLAARGDEILFSDADLATPIEELVNLRAAMKRDGTEIAIASRALPESDIRTRQHPLRELMGRTFNVILRSVVMGGVKDTQCGFKLFRGDVGRALFGEATVDGFAFDVEILLLAHAHKYRVSEVPVVWRHVEQSKVSPGRDAALMLWDVMKLSARRRLRRRS
jgi:dolichyl-phosphate beta-glucosyltransferase